jgi:L-iditol 2-dehydrogenase
VWALRKLGAGLPLTLEEMPERAPQPAELVVEVLGCGVCGTDLHIADDAYVGVHPPVTLGHEVVGEVVGGGDETDRAWLGRRVVCETYASTCGECAWCRSGRPNLCPSRRSIGSGIDGGFAHRLWIPARNCWRLADSTPLDAAVLAEPLACVLHGLEKLSMGVGRRAVVTGPGPIGLLACALLVASGMEVSVVGLVQDRERLELARFLGAHSTISLGEASTALPEGRFDMGVECSGAPSALGLLAHAVEPAGEVLRLGLGSGPAALETEVLDEVLRKELTLRSSFASNPKSWRLALRLLNEGRVEIGSIVTHVVALDAWPSAFELLRRGEGAKVVLVPQIAPWEAEARVIVHR